LLVKDLKFNLEKKHVFTSLLAVTKILIKN